jgi:DELLA protein
MVPDSRLSTEEVMRVARARFIQISCQQHIDLSLLNHFFDGHVAQFGSSGKEIKDMELALLLLASADKIENQQFDNASKSLNLCGFLSSKRGNSVQRVVHYFAKALGERIERKIGVVTLTGMESKGQLLHPEETTVTLNPALIACSLRQPYSQVSQFAGIQAVVERLTSAKKVHFIDLAIRSGGHCIVLMQALANRHERPVELLKITAVGTTSEQKMEEAGVKLSCFAETLSLPFSFKAITIENIKDLKEDMFELSDGEVVAIFSRIMLRTIKLLAIWRQAMSHLHYVLSGNT